MNSNGEGSWDIDWKASHWMVDRAPGEIPIGIQGAIVKEMVKDGLGDKLGDIVVNKGIPALVGAISEKIRNG